MDGGQPIPRAVFLPLAALILFVCYFGGLNNVGLVGPDEPRYAWVARAMAESGDWVTPRLYGETWFEKPVLYYWAAGAAFRAFGVSEFAARLPSALMALLATFALAGLAKRLYGPLAEQLTVLMVPTAVGMFGFARAATTDMLFSGALALAMACATVLVGFPSGTRPERYWLFFFGGALGLAALAKGPAAIVLAGGSVFLWMIITRKGREAFRLLRPEAIFAFAAVSLPWYVVCAMRNPEFIQVFLVSHNFERYLTPVFQHEQPFWFYGPILLLGLTPWTALLVAAISDGVRAIQARAVGDSAGFFLFCWALFPVVFFSASKSKLPGYILPAIPPLVLLLVRGISRAIEERRGGARWLVALTGLTFVALAVSAGYWAQRLPADSTLGDPQSRMMWMAAVGMCGFLIILLAVAGRPAGGIVASAVFFAALVAQVSYRELPRLDSYLSPRMAAQSVPRLEHLGPARAYRLHRAWHYGLNFYLHRRVDEWAPESRTTALVCTTERQAVRDILSRGYNIPTFTVPGGPTKMFLLQVVPKAP